MYRTLQERINPAINCLKYPETTKKLKNQVIEKLVSYLTSFDEGYEHVSNDIAESIISEFFISTGYETRDPDKYYNVKKFRELLLELNNEDFLNFLDICIQVIHSDGKLRDYRGYEEFISDLNTIMEMNGADLKIKDGRCIRISEPTIQE